MAGISLNISDISAFVRFGAPLLLPKVARAPLPNFLCSVRGPYFIGAPGQLPPLPPLDTPLTLGYYSTLATESKGTIFTCSFILE